jgi:hypothetical protein
VQPVLRFGPHDRPVAFIGDRSFPETTYIVALGYISGPVILRSEARVAYIVLLETGTVFRKLHQDVALFPAVAASPAAE